MPGFGSTGTIKLVSVLMKCHQLETNTVPHSTDGALLGNFSHLISLSVLVLLWMPCPIALEIFPGCIYPIPLRKNVPTPVLPRIEL